MSRHVNLHLNGSKPGEWKGICETEHTVFKEVREEDHKIHVVCVRYERGVGGPERGSVQWRKEETQDGRGAERVTLYLNMGAFHAVNT